VAYKYSPARVYYSGVRQIAYEVSPLKDYSLKAYVENGVGYAYEGAAVDNGLVRELANVYVGSNESYKGVVYYQS
jgi:hypothetical protein